MLKPGGQMNRRGANKRLRTEEPVWCDHCRVRIAPYEEATIAGAKAFHKHCFQKEETNRSDHDPFDGTGLTLALA
jgi:hypothetical protein